MFYKRIEVFGTPQEIAEFFAGDAVDQEQALFLQELSKAITKYMPKSWPQQCRYIVDTQGWDEVVRMQLIGQLEVLVDHLKDAHLTTTMNESEEHGA